jgi:hypothetical protein
MDAGEKPGDEGWGILMNARVGARRRQSVRSVRSGRRRAVRLAALTTVAAVAMLVATVTLAATGGPAASASLSYVSLGDSYTAGAGILPLSPGISPLCLQTTLNYPHLVASAEGYNLTDVSCSGATSGDMTTSQYPGVPPQFNAISSSTNVVTVGIGGNDNDLFVSALVDCALLDVGDFLNIGAPCKAVYGNTWSNDITGDASNIAGVLQGIHALAPGAKVLMVGYPDILPQSGNCYPTIPLTTGDTAYLNGVEEQLNSMLAAQAATIGATFVNTFTPSIGHDACKSANVRWVNPIIPSGGGISVHPNPTGESEMALFVEADL